MTLMKGGAPSNVNCIYGCNSQLNHNCYSIVFAILTHTSCAYKPAGAAAVPQNVTSGFVETFHVGVCSGRYTKPLVKAWQAWDKQNQSLNDFVGDLPGDQMYVIIAMADSGRDLEAFDVESFAHARALLMQVTFADTYPPVFDARSVPIILVFCKYLCVKHRGSWDITINGNFPKNLNVRHRSGLLLSAFQTSAMRQFPMASFIWSNGISFPERCAGCLDRGGG